MVCCLLLSRSYPAHHVSLNTPPIRIQGNLNGYMPKVYINVTRHDPGMWDMIFAKPYIVVIVHKYGSSYPSIVQALQLLVYEAD